MGGAEAECILLKQRERLFGTDGIRGVANADLTSPLVMQIGQAAGQVFLPKQVVVGRDTRRSGGMLSLSLQAGLQSVGVDTIDVGVIPIGGISRLITDLEAGLGVMVSASHNPAPDNGIKFLSAEGTKLTEEEEQQIEELIRNPATETLPTGPGVGSYQTLTNAADRYLDSLCAALPVSLDGLDVVVDAAHGAAYRVAPELFHRLGAKVASIGIDPDGTNINQDCGATHPQFLQRQTKGRIGISFDGDADRLILVDETGEICRGDVILAVLASHWKLTGRLTADTLVSTVMANLGLREFARRESLRLVETPVGDRHVLERMNQLGVNLGGEQSGHVILSDLGQTGDGLLTALAVLEVVTQTGSTLTDLRQQTITIFPQVLKNVTVNDSSDLSFLHQNQSLEAAIRKVEEELGDKGRVLVRPSGTEPVVRVMVEAATLDLAETHAASLAETISRLL